MASVEVSKLSQQEIAELACSYASLILYDDGQQITADKINSLINASGVKVQSYWAKLFAKAVSGQNISSMFNFGGSSAPSSAPVSSEPAKTESKPAAKQPAKKQEAPKEEEQQMDMGGLFD